MSSSVTIAALFMSIAIAPRGSWPEAPMRDVVCGA